MTRNHPGKPATAAAALPLAVTARAFSALALSLSLALFLSGCTGDGGQPAPGSTGSTASGATATPTPGTGSPGPTASGTSAPLASSVAPTPLRAPEVRSRIEGLQIPWSTVFLPDGTAVISERDSTLLKSVRDGRVGTIGAVPGVVPGGEGGLLGLALSPGFASDRYLYAYFTAAGDNRIARMRLEGSGSASGGGLRLGELEVIFSGMSKASTHNGGRIRFGPDGFLYVGTGDSQRREQPQDRNALGGKILRLTKDGAPAPGNPFPNNPVYSLGHRNVQGLAWDSQGRLWASEFGPDVNDELNLIQPGGNYGWPEVTGAPHRDGVIDAKVVWPSTADSSPSGLEIVGSTAYLGALRGQRIWAVPLDGENAGAPVGYFTQQFGRIRNVSLAPNGDLWALSNNQNPDFALILALPR
ncbi:sorbosone dehydrogenase family protein [Arthrobacter sp. ISL-65]|uniref:PQQ-dependent sugar dehydrogenase n=1 Tax=Arthrobacter sp. ISL-65 TaxID=2819112 RepID=UPI001BEABD6A|nr:PQQ-dependent sugar dehydrogenase [Arthrobacter sp. ISL-65]MBT2547948.1 PQQ-dependent sugar dehydrogenase [Arthrobacter sp. ISL-65]